MVCIFAAFRIRGSDHRYLVSVRTDIFHAKRRSAFWYVRDVKSQHSVSKDAEQAEVVLANLLRTLLVLCQAVRDVRLRRLSI
jgi:hypothetical protein